MYTPVSAWDLLCEWNGHYSNNESTYHVNPVTILIMEPFIAVM